MFPTYYQIPFYAQVPAKIICPPPTTTSKQLQVIYPPGPGSWGTPLPVPAGTPITYRLEQQRGRWTTVPHYHINTTTPTPTPTIAYPVAYPVAYPTYTYPTPIYPVPIATAAKPGYNTVHGYDRGNVPPGWPGNPVWQAVPVQYPVVPVPFSVPQYQVVQPVPVPVHVAVPVAVTAPAPARDNNAQPAPIPNPAPPAPAPASNNAQPAPAPAEPLAPTPANAAGQAAASRAQANQATADGSHGS